MNNYQIFNNKILGFIHRIKIRSFSVLIILNGIYCMQHLRFEMNMFLNQRNCNEQKIQYV